MLRLVKLEIGSKIRALRKERGWMQKDLAEKAGISAPLLSLIERGERDGSPDTIRKIAEVFSISSGLLFDPEVDVEHIVEMSGILEGMGHLDEEQLAAVRSMIKALQSSR